MKKITLMILLVLLPLALFAQRETAATVTIVTGTGFFTALAAGVILALGFQLILTNLSAAAGLSALHIPIEKAEESVRSGRREERPRGASSLLEKKLRTVSSAFGIWAAVTASISLFFAAWFAVELSTALTVAAGMILGLAVWGLFSIVTMSLESVAATSMIGSLFDLVRSGLKSFSETATGLFKPSEESKAVETARGIVEAVRDDVFRDENVKRTIRSYIEQLKPDYRRLRTEIEAVVDNAQIETSVPMAEGHLTARIHTGTKAPPHPRAREAAAGMVREGARAVREEARTDKERVEKVADAAMQMVGMSREEAEEYRKRLERYLADTGKEELNPEGIKRDLDKLISSDPKAGVDAILARLSEMDRSTITSILAQRKDMNTSEANRVIDMVAGTVNTLKSQYQREKGAAGPSMEMRGGPEAGMQDYLDSLDNPQLHYDGIRSDFETLLHDPGAGADSLIGKLRSINRHDLEQMIARSGLDMTEEDIDRTVSRIEQVRDSLITRAEEMRGEVTHQVREKVRMAEEEALHRAEEVRKVASSAAWWVFVATLCSGIAAALGGMVAVIT